MDDWFWLALAVLGAALLAASIVGMIAQERAFALEERERDRAQQERHEAMMRSLDELIVEAKAWQEAEAWRSREADGRD